MNLVYQARLGNAYITDIEETSLVVFTAAFCFAYAKYALIKFELYDD